ncbi:MAG TPA: hypothetical protein VGC91_19595 [Pyrinomonadaceae bacterium]
MLKKLSHETGATVKTPLLVKLIVMALMVAATACASFAQTQSNTNLNTGAAITAMVTDAKTAATSKVATATEPVISPANTSRKPLAQGASSNNQAYVFLRGYVFHIHRTHGDPAVINSNAVGNISSIDNFKYGTEGAFKIEAGWNATNNWGFRASYFYTNQTATENRTGAATAPFILSPRPLNVTFTGAAAPGTAATFNEKFRLSVIDVEGTYKWHSTTSSVVLSGGVRIAPSRQVYKANDIFVTTAENVTYTQKRTGWGPTGAIDVRHRIGGSSFWWTGAGRFALLFGKNKETATYTAGAFTQTATRRIGRTNPVWEGETGLEWNHTFPSGNEFFINGSFIIHDWVNIVNVIPTAGVGSSATAAFDNPTAAPSKKGSIIFVGGSFSLGFRF